MPVLRAEKSDVALEDWVSDMVGAPGWCELEKYSIVSLPSRGERRWNAGHGANKLVVVEGACAVEVGGQRLVVERGQSVDVPPGEHRVRTETGATYAELGGHWGSECGGSGVFGVVEAEELGDRGDPVDYPKRTRFDRHYHDCDEYWILVSGRGTACSENVLYEVGPGDCVVTGMGHHHDFPLVDEPVMAVFFETTMWGQCRRGHLWEHTHGRAVPAVEGSV